MSTKKHIALTSFWQTTIFIFFVVMLPVKQLFAQAELRPWGNLDGIRIKGQLFEFNTSLTVAGKSWRKAVSTGKELQKPKYKRNGDEQTVITQIDSVQFTEVVKDDGRGSVIVSVKCLIKKDTLVKGIYFYMGLPVNTYAGSIVKVFHAKDQPFDPLQLSEAGEYFRYNADGISFTTPSQKLTLHTDTSSLIIARSDSGVKKELIRLYFPICSGKLNKGDIFQKTYKINVSGKIDQSPLTLQLDTTVKGRTFAGFGGNFRLQNPKTDPQVIDYCLKNLQVTWGRVELPWRNWQPDISTDPFRASTDTTKLNLHLRQSMEMAARLNKMNMPVILTAWGPPAWAVTGRLQFGKSPQGIWGNPLNTANTSLIYQSITDYILYLKKYYGFEVTFFSFNESDLGINVRQTGQEHDDLIKGLGAYFASKGLKTKLLLGDNSDATTYSFIYPAMNDPEARPYMGAISFHSWRGWETETLQKWADAAKQTGLPLLVGEGSIDAAGYAYPAYFQEQSYALEEINLYTRLMAICQPLSILQWQLTADYSPLTGGGIYGDNSPLKPTQRFWNLKQFASTPPGLFYMPLTGDKPGISCAALGDAAKRSYTFHIVNNGTARKVHLTGLPSGIKELKVYVTSKGVDMKQFKSIKVIDHQADFDLGSRCFTSLFSE